MSQVEMTTVDETTLRDTVAFVWSTLYGIEPTCTDATPIGDGVTASIAIGGSWTATIVVEMRSELALASAAGLFMMEPDEIDDSLLSDAVGEIVNMVGGNVKGLVDDPSSTLSLPVVARTSQSIVGGVVTVEAGFEVDGSAMTWRIHESR